MSLIAPSTTESTHPDVKKHLKRNYLAHTLEGGFYIGGIAFVQGDTIIPKIAESLGAHPLLIAYIPSLTIIGFLLPGFFTANFIGRQKSYLPILKITGILQRLPYLIAGLLLIFWNQDHAYFLLFVLVLTPFISGVLGGLTLPAWQALYSRTIPREKRASSFSVRFIIAGVIGVLAGLFIKYILELYPDNLGYGILHLTTFFFLTISYLIFIKIKEPNYAPPESNKEVTPFFQKIRETPKLLKKEKDISFFFLSQICFFSFTITAPYLIIFILKSLNLKELHLGSFLTAQMCGLVFGNLAVGAIADKIGPKSPAIMLRVIFLISLLLIPLATTQEHFMLIVFAYGLFLSTRTLNMPFLLELTPIENKTAFLALSNLVSLIPLFSFPLITYFFIRDKVVNMNLEDIKEAFYNLNMIVAIFITLSILFLAKVKEPRRKEEGQI